MITLVTRVCCEEVGQRDLLPRRVVRKNAGIDTFAQSGPMSAK